MATGGGYWLLSESRQSPIKIHFPKYYPQTIIFLDDRELAIYNFLCLGSFFMKMNEHLSSQKKIMNWVISQPIPFWKSFELYPAMTRSQWTKRWTILPNWYYGHQWNGRHLMCWRSRLIMERSTGSCRINYSSFCRMNQLWCLNDRWLNSKSMDWTPMETKKTWQ